MSKIFVISGPAGVGQGTIIKELLKEPELNLQWVKGYTSRAPRETDLKENKYNFVTKEEFKHLTKTGEIFEWTFYNNHYYGSSRSAIEKIINENKNAIRDVDPIEGGKLYRKFFPHAKQIFITADLGSIRQRLINRGQNTSEEIEARLKIAEEEMKHAKYYDYVVENTEGHPEKAVAEIEKIIKNNTNDIKISVAKISDIPEMCQVHKRVWLDTYTAKVCGLCQTDILNKDFDSPKKIGKWKYSLEDANYRIWVAKAGNKIVGFCGGRIGDHENDFSVIYILPDFQHMGIGKKFAQKVLKWFGSSKPTAVEVAKCNEKAINFYKKLGFSEPKPIDPTILTNGKRIEIVKMYLRRPNG